MGEYGLVIFSTVCVLFNGFCCVSHESLDCFIPDYTLKVDAAIVTEDAIIPIT